MHTLPDTWRARAAELRPYAPAAAEAFTRAAGELEEALRADADTLLTLTEAAAESGYSERRLRDFLSDGSIPNAGRKGAPRIRRADLPRRPVPPSSYDPSEDALALLARMR